ncbi:hypothetical protein LDB17_00140 [Dysgonomonas sp. Shenzhen-Wh21]|uniref:hypothetical protein n=1 Tax=Dysgonomonas TaxID=156973 RepID=UPI00208F1FC9|nr:hypothetical protein [Dysgonomonas mossii]
MKKFKTPIIIYLISTISFSVIYFLFWKTNTTSFVISKQINEKTHDIGVYSFEAITPYYIRNNDIPFDIHEFNQFLLKPIFDTINILEYKKKNISVAMSATKQHLDSLSVHLNQSYASNLEKSIDEKTRLFRDSIKIIDEKILNINQVNTLDKDIVVANFKVCH